MKNELCKIKSNTQLTDTVFSMEFCSGYLAAESLPGQFYNIETGLDKSFILRRPFSVANVKNDIIEIIYDVVGKGTKSLSEMKKDDILDVVGPLGKGFDLSGQYDTALLLAGGIGIAPFPYVINNLNKLNKKFKMLSGFRNKDSIINLNLAEEIITTDDGSHGLKGNVVDLLDNYLKENNISFPKIFACGPNPMLKAVMRYAEQNNIHAEISMESNMACGFGICQGCPVESKIEENKYYLICKDGPVFNSKHIKF